MSDGLPATLHLKVVAPRRLLVETDVEAVFLPTLEGQIGVFPGHRPLFVGLGRGRIVYREGGAEDSVAVRGGYAQVQPEKVIVMTEVGEDDEAGGAAA
ncbi:MAG TPA: F0F1 ATP synthase subunit epsilon [Candidatus Aminicenantes bacterium]|nr:F0F1 ATP synthase subunit epsilon [Candidatus Aminicenantes bacterium]